MRVLVVDVQNANREAVAAALRGTRHAVELFGEAEAALQRAKEPGADVIVFGALSATLALDLARRARALSHKPYLLYVTPSARQDDLDAILAAGVDDFVRRPFFEDELRVRVEGALRGRAASSTSGVRPAVTERSGVARVASLASWTALPKLVTTELAATVRAPFALVPGDQLPFAEPPWVGRVACTLPADRVEIELRMAADARSVEKLATAVLHEPPPPEMYADIIGEFVNIAAGAFKRAALNDGATFTLGLPQAVRGGDLTGQEGGASRAFTAESRALGCKVSFLASMRATEPRRVPTARLREGMVLSEDLVAPTGALIASAGTRITAAAAERVERFLGKSFLVGVALTSRLPEKGRWAAPPVKARR